MWIRVINPNTTSGMTAIIERAARAVAGPGVRVDAVTPEMGPASIESHYDEALSVPGVLKAIADGESAGADGYVLACFGDPGLDAAREAARGPVVGIAEAAMHAASFIGRTFSVVTTLNRTRGRAWELAGRYVAPGTCRGVYACEIPVLDLGPGAADPVIALARTALERDGSDAIVLGCAGMADLCASVSEATGVPVIDGVAAATTFVRALVTLGLRTSKHGEYATPPAKPYTGLLTGFGLTYADGFQGRTEVLPAAGA